MASNGEQLPVNSEPLNSGSNKFNQISGIKKGLESVIADSRKSYEDKFGSLVSSWDCLSSFASSKKLCPLHQSNITSLIKWIHPITVRLVIHTGWQKLRNISKKTISHALRRCLTLVKAQEDVQVLESLQILIKDPWSDPILIKLFDKSKLNIDHVKDSEVLAFCNSQGAMTLALRLEALSNSYCDNLCGNLSEACMRCLTLDGCNLGELGVDGDKRYIHYIIDIRVAVLVKRKQLKRVFGQLNKYGLEAAQKLVQRFRARVPNISNEKPTLWSFTGDVTMIVAQYCLTKAMVAPVNNVELVISVMTIWVEEYAYLRESFPSVAENIVKTAASSRHVFLFADVLKRKFGAQYTTLYIVYYIRGLLLSVNELEYLKTFKEKNLTLIREMEVRMSDGFIHLANLSKVNEVVYGECFLTAFSLNPTKECLDELKRIGERRHQKNPLAGCTVPHVCVPPTDYSNDRVISNDDGSVLVANNNEVDTVNKVIVECGSNGDGKVVVDVGGNRPKESVGSETSSEGMKTGVLCSMCGSFLLEEISQNMGSWGPVSVDNEGLGLSSDVLDDLLVVLSSPRWRLLTWLLSWPELEKACELYLQNAPSRNTEKELTFLNKNIDYDQFDCWKYPKESEEEYPGIEKGYENCLLAEEDEEEEEIEEPPRKTKTVKKQTSFIDSDSSADRRKKARRKWKKSDDVDYKVRPHVKPRVAKKRNLFLSSVSEYETTTQDSVRTEGNSDTYSLSPVEMDRSPASRKMDIVLDCPPLKLPPIAFGFDENGKKFANIVDSKHLSDPKTLKSLRMFRNPAKKLTVEKKDKDVNHKYAPMLSTLDLNPRIVLHRTEETSPAKKLPAPLSSKNVIRASLENYLPRSDRVSAAVSPASAKSRPVLDFLTSKLLAQDRLGIEEETEDRLLMKAHIPGLTTLDMIVPLPAETSVHIVQLPQSVPSTGGGQGGGQSVPPPKPAAQTSTPPTPPTTQPPVIAAPTPSRAARERERVTITSILQSQPGLSYAIRSVQVAPVPKASNETATSEMAKPTEETPPAEATLSQTDANESLPKFHQAFTKTSRVLYCQPSGVVATTSQEAAAPPEDAPEAVPSTPVVTVAKEGQTGKAQVNTSGQVRQPLQVHVAPIRPPGQVVQVGTSQSRPPGQVVQIGPSGQLRQPGVVQLGTAGQMKQAGQIVQVSSTGQISRAVQMTQVIQSPQASGTPVGQITASGMIGQASQVISGQIAQANQPGQPIGNLNLVMSMPPILRMVQNPTVYIGQISAAAKTSFLTTSGDSASPSMSIVLSKETRPGFVNRSTAAPPESSSDDDASLPKPPNYASAAGDEMATSAGDLSPRSTSTYEQLQEFESVLKQIKEKGEIQGDVTSPTASTAVIHAVQAGAIGTIPCVKVPMSRIPTAANVAAANALKTVGAKGTKLLMVTTSCPSLTAPAAPTVASPGKTPPKSGKTSKPKSAKTSPTTAAAAATAAKSSPIAKPQQKPQEDEQTTQRIYDILNQYAEQLRNSPDLNNKPAPRRRSNPPTNPGPSKRKKSATKAKSTTAEMSPGVDDPAADEDDSSSTTLIHMGGVHDSPAPSQQSADEGQSQSVGASLEASTEGGNLKSVVMDPQESNKEKVAETDANPSPAGGKPTVVASSSGTGHFLMNSNIGQILSIMKSPGKVILRGHNMQLIVRQSASTGKAQGLTALCGSGHQRLDHNSITLGLSPIRSSLSSATVSAVTSTPLSSESQLETAQASRRDIFQCGGMEVMLKDIPQMFAEAAAAASTPSAVMAIQSPPEKEETVNDGATSATGLLEEAVPDGVPTEDGVGAVAAMSFATGQQIDVRATPNETHPDLEVDSASTELSEAQKMFECADKATDEEEDDEENVDREEIERDDNTEPEPLESGTACATSTPAPIVSKSVPTNPEAVTFLAGIIDANPGGTPALAAGVSRKLASMLSSPGGSQIPRAAPKATDGSSEDEATPFVHLDSAAAKPGFSGGADGAQKHFHEAKPESSRPILSKNPSGVVRKYKGKRPVTNLIDNAVNTFSRKVAITLRASSRPYNAQPLPKSLSEECEDLGVDCPSTNDLFPETLLMMDADTSSSPGFEMAAVVPCPIDLNKHVPMFSGAAIGENIEIASNVEIGSSIEIESNVEIDSNVEMDTTMEIASNVEIGSNIEHGWNGSNDDSQLPRSRASSTSSSSSSSRSSSSSSSSSSSGGKPLSDEFNPVRESTAFSPALESTEITTIVESSPSAPDASNADSSPAPEVAIIPVQNTAGKTEETIRLAEAVQCAVSNKSAIGESNSAAVVVILPSEEDATPGIAVDKGTIAEHFQPESECWSVVVASTPDITTSTSDPTNDLGAGGAESSAGLPIVTSPSGQSSLPQLHSIVAKLSTSSCSPSPNISEKLLEKSASDIHKAAEENNSTTGNAGLRPSVTDLKEEASSQGQRRSSVIVTTSIAETESDPDSTFLSASSYSAHYTTALDFTAVGEGTEIIETTLEEESRSDNGDAETMEEENETLVISYESKKADTNILVQGSESTVDAIVHKSISTEIEDPSESKDSDEEDNDANVLEKNTVHVDAEDTQTQTSSDADCPANGQTLILNENNAPSCEASTDFSDVTQAHDCVNVSPAAPASVLPLSVNFGSLGSTDQNNCEQDDVHVPDHAEEFCDKMQRDKDTSVFLEKAANMCPIQDENPSSEPSLHSVDVVPALDKDSVEVDKLEGLPTQTLSDATCPPTVTPKQNDENIAVYEATAECSEREQGTVKDQSVSSPEPDIVALQAGSISPGSSGQYNYDAEDSNGVDLSSVSIPGEAEHLSEQDASEDDPHSPSSNTNDGTKALPPRYKVAPVERVNTRSLSRGYSRSQSSQDGSVSVEQPGEVTDLPKKGLIKRGKPPWSEIFPSKKSRSIGRKKMKISAAASTDDTTTSDEEVPKRRFPLPAIVKETLAKLPTLMEDPDEESVIAAVEPLKLSSVVKGYTIAEELPSMKPLSITTPMIEPQEETTIIMPIPVGQLANKPKKRGRKPRATVRAAAEAGERVISDVQTLPMIKEAASEVTPSATIKAKPKRAPVNWTDKEKAIKLAKERENDSATLPGPRQKRRKKEAGSKVKKAKVDNLNGSRGGPSCASGSTLPPEIPVINGDTISMVIEAVVAEAALHDTLSEPSVDSVPGVHVCDSHEPVPGVCLQQDQNSDSNEFNPGRSNASANGLPQQDASSIPKRRGRKKFLREELAEASEAESSDRGGRKKIKMDCEHILDATAGTSSSRVKRSQRSHKVKGCNCCNGASTKKTGSGLAMKGEKKVEKEPKPENKEIKPEKSDKEPRPEKDINLEKASTCKAEKRDGSSSVERRESTKLEKEEPEKCPGNVEKAKKTSAATKIPVKLNNNRKR